MTNCVLIRNRRLFTEFKFAILFAAGVVGMFSNYENLSNTTDSANLSVCGSNISPSRPTFLHPTIRPVHRPYSQNRCTPRRSLQLLISPRQDLLRPSGRQSRSTQQPLRIAHHQCSEHARNLAGRLFNRPSRRLCRHEWHWKWRLLRYHADGRRECIRKCEAELSDGYDGNGMDRRISSRCTNCWLHFGCIWWCGSRSEGLSPSNILFRFDGIGCGSLGRIGTLDNV